MRVTVVSMMAAAHGRESITWTGDVAVSRHAEPDQINERLFRMFNRVDESDARYLQARGYDLPSLSVGDYLHWESQTWRVEGSGFSLYTGSEGAFRASLGI
jgi:hypothetical protein